MSADSLQPQSEALREAFDRRFTLPERTKKAAQHGFLALFVAREVYALPMSEVGGVVRNISLTRLPSDRPNVLGLGSVRGTLAPVFSLARILGREDSISASAEWVVLLNAPSGEIALSCDRIFGLRWADTPGEKGTVVLPEGIATILHADKLAI